MADTGVDFVETAADKMADMTVAAEAGDAAETVVATPETAEATKEEAEDAVEEPAEAEAETDDSKENLKELRERALAQYETVGEEKQRMQRLNFLLEKSAAYVTFVARRLEDKRAEKRQVKRPAPEAKKEKRKTKKQRIAESEAKDADSEAAKDEDDEERIINGQRVSARQPRAISGGIMKDYQLEGMEWLASLYENGLNGILADEMGLGKTLQTIAFLAYLRERQVWGPFLVLCPLSTLANWASEFYRFAPQTPVLMYHGTPDERRTLRRKHLRTLDRNFPIVITTYEISMRDKQALQRFAWKFIIVDEGHRIKNMNCKLIRDLKSYQSTNRLLLSGTPLQNSLSELWSLLNFLLPDIFDDLDSFQAWFDFDDIADASGQSRIISQETSGSVVSKLHSILQPFLLRRLKSDVEKHLPPKREYLIACPMAPLQFEYYQAIRGPNLRAFLEDRFASDDQQTLVPNTPEPTAKPKPKSKHTRASGRDEQQRLLVAEAEQFLGVSLSGSRAKPTKSYRECEDDDPFDLPSDSELAANKDTADVEDEGATSGLARLKAAVQVRQLNLQFRLMQQRKVCQHPYLFDFPVTDPSDPESPYLIDEQIVRTSGKLLMLDRLLPALFARGHRVLVFSQFSRVLDILECYAELRKWEFCRIDGSVAQTDRQEAIVRFNTSQIPLFFLTTRSGGLGINLTSADTVVLFDSDWNPQQDLQAQDRVHRIGQTKPVIIYRLTIAGSCENAMLSRAKAKRKLEKLVIHERRFKGLGAKDADNTVSVQDIRQILLGDDTELVTKDQLELKTVLDALGPEDSIPDDLVLSTDELEALLDRSPEAYLKRKDHASDRIAQIEDVPDERNDMLAKMDA
ncbi:putative ATPase [Coemansia sp. RSA 353]|nr:putative ATPase [Coemansia sp. RSA 564]KAJ2168000.1 putative ATPase [Coemansia sp. RSA 562]KAJ2188184.1 putative ATPase [Coemansia sp. RSA 532]KAJ2197896.1 putative ATPase [Coemansia sp. RSA 522]KAJ2206898.1 putative ATPase [Coemansia sp. RSA 521]KAJ2223745.1 putative ATPase [Coemansia sp. RSA 520]KAJ2228157.1 putative ATPase [Coemansia sp. RSA 518]KAJ2249673.1 putative ATPase [Coemansia sp. RSA 475]KAJ2274088.1 putative ATPase [Coemansia sp. RSA 371]KAJ2279715.1 putative ATPase [Coeman